MPLLPETKNVDYQSLPFQEPDDKAVIFHLAAHVDELLLHLPVPIMDSEDKTKFLDSLKKLTKDLETKFGKDINARIFKLKLAPPGKIKDIYDRVKRPVVEANYDVAYMIICDSQAIADKVEEDASYKEIYDMFNSRKDHDITVCKNVRKAGDTHIHDHYKQGVYLFNYFYVEDTDFDFIPVWDHTGRWFVEYTKLDNSYLLQPIKGDKNFQYINHAYWHGLHEFVPQLVLNRSFKKYVLDNFTYNNAVALPLIYEVHS